MNKIDGSLEGGNDEIPICEGRESGRESVIAGIQPKILWKAFIWLSELPQLRTDEANRDGRRFAENIIPQLKNSNWAEKGRSLRNVFIFGFEDEKEYKPMPAFHAIREEIVLLRKWMRCSRDRRWCGREMFRIECHENERNEFFHFLVKSLWHEDEILIWNASRAIT